METYCHTSAQAAHHAFDLGRADSRELAAERLEQECREALLAMKPWEYPHRAAPFRIGTCTVGGSDVMEAMIDLDESAFIEALAMAGTDPIQACRELGMLQRHAVEQVLGGINFTEIAELTTTENAA